MRLLGFLFLIVLVLAAVGYFRGWFTVTTTHAGSTTGVTLQVDKDKVDLDTRSAAARLDELSARAAEKVRALGRKISPEASELEGAVTGVDVLKRDLTVSASSQAVELQQTIDLHVPSTIPVMRDGKSVGFEELRPGTKVKLTFKDSGDVRYLGRIDILR
jgi:hypothetical protein